MKKLFRGKTISILLVVMLVLGGTAALAAAVSAAQSAADKEVVVNYIPGYDSAHEYETDTTPTPMNQQYESEINGAPTLAVQPPATVIEVTLTPTNRPPGDEISTEPRPQDITGLEAFNIVRNEIKRVFGYDTSGYEGSGSYLWAYDISHVGIFGGIEPNRPFWEINIYRHGEMDYRYLSSVDAVTGQISFLHFGNWSLPNEGVPEGDSPLPGDFRYNEAALRAMSVIDSEASVVKVQFFRVGSTGTQVVYWIAVSLNNGNDYLIGITKEDRTFIGYSYIEGRIDERLFSLFNDDPDSPVILGTALPFLDIYPGVWTMEDRIRIHPITKEERRYQLEGIITARVQCASAAGLTIVFAEAGFEDTPVNVICPIMEGYDTHLVSLNIGEMFPRGFTGQIWAVASTTIEGTVTEFASEKIDAIYLAGA